MVKSVDHHEIELVKRLVDRLERLSADSTYAHRASGLRGSLLHYLGRLETGQSIGVGEQVDIDNLMEYGFEILELAAKELGERR